MSATEILTIGSVIKHRGEYNSDTIYYTNNQVTICNCVFQALGNNFSGVSPIKENSDGTIELANTTTWKCVIDNIKLYNAALSTHNLDDRTAAVEEQLATLDGVVGRMDVGAIDAVPASVADALAMAKDMTHSRWTLTYRGVLNVGVVDVFSDNMGHQLTEVLTTHYSMKDGVLDFTQHDDGAVQVYWRSYNINSPYLKNEKGTWTDWAEHVAATVRTELDDLDEAAAAAQKTADAALEASAMVLKDTTALKDAVGKAGGIAMLDGDMKIPVANLPEKAVGVLEFQGTVQGVSALDMSTAQYAGVAFDTVARCFYAYTVSGSGLTGTRIYYKSWDGWQHYQDGTPYSGKIYMDTTTDTPYRWNGTTMKALVPKTVALTQEEYDDMAAAGTLDDDTYYNILEE